MERKGLAALQQVQNCRLTIVRVITLGNRPTYSDSLCTEDSHTNQVNFKHRRTAFYTKCYKTIQSLILKRTTKTLQQSLWIKRQVQYSRLQPQEAVKVAI